MMRTASLSRTFHSVRCSGRDDGVSLSSGYLRSRPGRSAQVWPSRPKFVDHDTRRQTHGKLKNKKNENIGTKAAPKLTITGVIAAGGPLSPATIEALNKVAKTVPPKWRHYVAYKDDIKVGGSLSWRANNPGNLRAADTEIAKVPGAHGKFAVFATMEQGRTAQKRLYVNKYGGQNVRTAVEALTPPSENDTSKYLNDLENAGINLDDTVKNQIEKLMPAIKTNEGLIEGSTISRETEVTRDVKITSPNRELQN